MDKPEELKRKMKEIHHMPLAWWLFHLDVADTIDVYEVDGSGDAEAACHTKALYTGSPVDWLSENGKALLALAARPVIWATHSEAEHDIALVLAAKQ
jgi:hypothetical protein